MGSDAMILVFWILSFKPTFPLSWFTLIKRHFSSSSLSAIRVVLSAYLNFLIFLLALLIPACSSSSPAFLMMYSAYKLNKQVTIYSLDILLFLFASGGQSIGLSALASVLPLNTQDWSPSEWTGWISLQSKGPSRVFSNTTVQKHQFFGAQLSS